MSEGQRDLLITEVGVIWDQWGQQMRVFWNSYCIEPWNVWSMGLCEVPLCSPSNNCQESYHEELKTKKIPNLMRGSTEAVFQYTLPQLIQLDGLLKPTELCFEVPAIPVGAMEKALWLVENQKSHVHVAKDDEGDFFYYVLKKDNDYGAKKITKKLIQDFMATMRGEKPKCVKDIDTLCALCEVLHIVMEPQPAYPVLPCEGNPLGLTCVACKAFQGVGICSHVLAISLRRLSSKSKEEEGLHWKPKEECSSPPVRSSFSA